MEQQTGLALKGRVRRDAEERRRSGLRENEIRLMKLILRDFQGGSVEIDLNGRDANIYAGNAGGKTRLVSAFSWLLFNKDALGRSDFEIKNLDAEGNPEHNLEHTVECRLVWNGETVVLSKVLSEKWTKRRGSANREFQGHTVSYQVNGVPEQEKAFQAYVAEIAGDESRFRLLTSPTAFPSLHWQKQRALLLEICGDISDADIIASDPKLSPLTAILGRRTLEDHRKVVTARRSEINKELERIPVRVDEVRRGLPDITGLDRSAEEAQVKAIEARLADAGLRMQGFDSGGNIAELSKKIEGLRSDLRKLEAAHRAGSLEAINRLNLEIVELGRKVRSNRGRQDQINGDLRTKDLLLVQDRQILAGLRDKWTAIDQEKFEDSTEAVCPACSRPLPIEQVQTAREKALAGFNESKAERLKEVNDRGLQKKEMGEQVQKEISALRIELEQLKKELPGLEETMNKTISDRDALKRAAEDVSGLNGRADLLDEIDVLEQQIAADREGKKEDTDKIQLEISNLKNLLSGAKGKIDLFVRREQGEKRVEELKTQEKALAAEFEKLEGELFLVDEFIKAKVAMLTERINAKFPTVRFKLFDVQINQGISDCCEITVNGVPYSGGLNNAARINAGLEIVRVLQEHYKIRVPVFADNAEAVNELTEVGCQMIRLYVSEDKGLRVELK